MKEEKILLEPIGGRHLLLGNEALARGAIESGVNIVTTYPGTPSSEITDSLAKVADKAGIYVEYSTNEIVAVETAAGASICGARSLTSMKHVGLNVASDAFITLAYIGVKGGFVLVSVDDPYCWSSQNEQDNRYYAFLANVPCFEPSNPQEAKDMLLHAFPLSEKLELPIMLRLVTRVSHMRGIVTFGQIQQRKAPKFVKDPKRFVMVPENARVRHQVLAQKMDSAKELSEKSQFNIASRQGKLGIITSGVSFNYCVEALKTLNCDASVLKLGMIHPLPEKLISSFLSEYSPVYVVEELEPFLETQIKAISSSTAKARVYGKLDGFIPRAGELSTTTVAYALSRFLHIPFRDNKNLEKAAEAEKLSIRRPPVLCPGCPHTASFYTIKIAAGEKAIYPSDIGCYALGYQQPLSVGDILICMGASAGLSCGISKVSGEPVIGVVGDSTFFHASIPGLINAVYNDHKFVYVVLDNLATAMTNFQPHPGTGVTGMGEPAKRVLIEDIAKACGVDFVRVVDPFDLKLAVSIMREALKQPKVAVVVYRRLCALLEQQQKRLKGKKNIHYSILKEKCNNCLACVKLLGCPALVVQDGKVVLDDVFCVGCGVCAQVCPYKAIVKRVNLLEK